MASFLQFIRERQYITNVTPATVAWYKHSLRWLPTDKPTQEDLKNLVLRMREKGLKPTGVNSVSRAVNAYLRWSGSPLKIQKLKEPQEIFPTFTVGQVSSIVRWKPKGFYKIRLQL